MLQIGGCVAVPIVPGLAHRASPDTHRQRQVLQHMPASRSRSCCWRTSGLPPPPRRRACRSCSRPPSACCAMRRIGGCRGWGGFVGIPQAQSRLERLCGLVLSLAVGWHRVSDKNRYMTLLLALRPQDCPGSRGACERHVPIPQEVPRHSPPLGSSTPAWRCFCFQWQSLRKRSLRLSSSHSAQGTSRTSFENSRNAAAICSLPLCAESPVLLVRGWIAREAKPPYRGLDCCSMYCLTTDSGAPPTLPAK